MYRKSLAALLFAAACSISIYADDAYAAEEAPAPRAVEAKKPDGPGAKFGGKFGGKLDPEKLKALKEKFGGKLDPEKLKEKLKNLDPEKLKELKEKFGGKLDPEKLKELKEKFQKPKD